MSLRRRRIGGRARRWQPVATCTRRCTAGSPPAPRIPAAGCYTNEVAVVTGASKGSIAASVVAQLLAGGGTVIATTSRARRRPTGVLQVALPRQRPIRRDAVGGSGQHGVLLRHRRSGRVGGQRADGEPGPQGHPPQGCDDPDAAVPLRRAARGRGPVRGGFALRDGDEGAAVGRSAAHRWAVHHRCGPRHRGPTARGAARFTQPRHVRRRRRLRRVQVRTRRSWCPGGAPSRPGRQRFPWRTR